MIPNLMLCERLICMDLKERTAKSILIRYIFTTLILWGLSFGVFAILLWWGIAGNNSMAYALIAPVASTLIFAPILISQKSARVSLSNQQIIPSDTHLKGLIGMIIIANLVIYSLPFIFLFILMDGTSYYLFVSIALVVVNIAVFLSTFWMFRPRETKLTAKVETGENDAFHKDEDDNLSGVEVEKLSKFKIYPSKQDIRKSYDAVLRGIFKFSFGGMILGALLDQPILFFILLFLSPILGFCLLYYRLNYYKFKRHPIPFEIQHGHQLTRMIFRVNLIFFFVLAGLFTLLLFSFVFDGDISADIIFWILFGLMWLFFILSFLPLFVLSHLYFKKLEREAFDAGRILAEHSLQLKKMRIKGKKTDDALRAFFREIGLGNIDYLFGGMTSGMNIDDPLSQALSPTIIAFNATDVYLFSDEISKVSFIMTFPTSVMTIVRALEHKSERRVQFSIGQAAPLLFIAYVDKKELIKQDKMFQRFINI